MTPVRRNQERGAAVSTVPSPLRPLFTQRTLHAALLAFYTAIYLSITLPIASKRLLWTDELFTLTLASRPFHEMWRLLVTGGDQSPLAFCAISEAVFRLGGPRELAIRSPEIFGFGLMGIALFEFAAFRTSLWHGAIAAFLPCLTAAYLYAFEARPYGLVLGFAALALVLWQRASTDRPGRFARTGFALALMAAVAVHYYAIFVIVPFAAAEAFRSWRRGSFRIYEWLPMGAALIPLCIAAPILANAGKVAKAFWAHASWRSIPEAYFELLGKHFMAALAAAGLVGICALLLHGSPQTTRADVRRPPIHEIICVIVFAALPFLVVPAAKLTTGAFVGRYVISTIIGVSILITWALYLFNRNRTAVVLMLAATVLGTIASGYSKYRTFTTDRQDKLSDVAKLLESRPQSLPLVMEDPQLFLQLFHYAPPGLTGRMVYLADVSLARRYRGTDTVDFEMTTMGVAGGVRVSGFDGFFRSTPRFLVYGYPSDAQAFLADFGWLIPELLSRHAVIQILDDIDGRLLMLVERANQ